MKFERSSGVLLHPTSLPGQYGIGDIGPQAIRWIEFLAEAGCSLWQVLPLGPTGYGDSPYQCFSAFAGNPYLVSPDNLLEDGLLSPSDLLVLPESVEGKVNFGEVIPWKVSLLKRAFERLQDSDSLSLLNAFNKFRSTHSSWVEDFALFMALKEAHGGASWVSWEASLRDRKETALAKARKQHKTAIDMQVFWQFLFFKQWEEVRAKAHSRGIKIIGDAPIFVAHDSADVWAHPELFYLNKNGTPTVKAGVPPDYFSPTGQLWGNPLYRWDLHQAEGYQWWMERIRLVLGMVDIVRLDHFRGFAGYWEVPGRAKTAVRGRWVSAPGMDFFRNLQARMGDLPIIAEDLGVITPDVVEIRDHFNLPGMKILQFGFGGGPTDPFLPHNYPTNCVVYTGTHDNDTARGWYDRVSEKEKDFYRRYYARDGSDVSWDLIRGAWASVADMALCPLQDVLCLGNEARMNYPGNPSGNWTWRMREVDLSESLASGLYELNYLYSRLNPVTEKARKSKAPKKEP